MPNYFAEKAAALQAMGYYPNPVLPSTKRPMLSDWPHYRFSPADSQRYAHCSVSLLTGVSGLLGADMDINNKALAFDMSLYFRGHWGLTVERIGKAPKTARLYRMDPKHVTGKVQSPVFRMPGDKQTNRLEFLGLGNYLVTHGIHPDTGKEYHWTTPGPEITPFSSLPLIEPHQLQEAIAFFNERCRAAGMTESSTHREIALQRKPSKKGQRAVDVERVRALAASIPNTDLSYDEWMRIGLAMKGAFGDTAEGVETWLDISAQYHGNDIDTCMAKWDSFHPREIGAGTLVHLAETLRQKQMLKVFGPIGAPSPERAQASAAPAAAPADEPGQAEAAAEPQPQRDAPGEARDDEPPAAAPADEADEQAEAPYIMSLAQFDRTIGYPAYLVEGVMRLASIYTVTANPGGGKTSLMTYLGACVQSGRPFAGLPVQRGNVLYLCADDPRGMLERFKALEQSGYELDKLQVSGDPFSLMDPKMQQRVYDRALAVGGLSLVVIDTILPYTSSSDVDSENDNLQMSRFLSVARQYTRLPGGPTIAIQCHPRKNAANTAEDLVPRGGSAVLGASDGNIAVWIEVDVIHMHHSAKMRGAFDELQFQLHRGVVLKNKTDAGGRPVTTVMVEHISTDMAAQMQATSLAGRERVLQFLRKQDSGVWFSAAHISAGVTFGSKSGSVDLRTVRRYLADLVEANLVRRSADKARPLYKAVPMRGN